MITCEERVNALDEYHFEEYAKFAKRQLEALNHAFIDLQPGDGTTYKIVIVRPSLETRVSSYHPTGFKLEEDAPYLVCTSFGPLYEWNSTMWMSWDYVADKWVADRREWTARVIARFLNRLRQEIG